jgi:hypothetical protein
LKSLYSSTKESVSKTLIYKERHINTTSTQVVVELLVVAQVLLHLLLVEVLLHHLLLKLLLVMMVLLNCQKVGLGIVVHRVLWLVMLVLNLLRLCRKRLDNR